MSQKKKKVIWHKKQGRFLPPSSLKAQHPAGGGSDPVLPAGPTRQQPGHFKQNLIEKIKRAARDG